MARCQPVGPFAARDASGGIVLAAGVLVVVALGVFLGSAPGSRPTPTGSLAAASPRRAPPTSPTR